MDRISTGAARAGINWLGANREQWTQRVNGDNQVETRVWRILSFSLGLRALMHPCGERDIGDPAVAEVAQHIDSLWRDDQQGWVELPGLDASTSGGYAVIAAIHTLKRVWPFDPFEQLGLRVQRRNGRGGAPRAHRILHVSVSERGIRLEDSSESLILQTQIEGPSQWTILITLAKRHYEAVSRGSTNQTEMTVSLNDCAQIHANGRRSKPESVTRALHRLNEKLRAEASKQSRRAFVELIEDHVPPGTIERRLALEEIEVRFTDELPGMSST
ncbi:MAG TPA: hypothetical protein VGL68_06325 [Solirubrobacteraceae bacterium]